MVAITSAGIGNAVHLFLITLFPDDRLIGPEEPVMPTNPSDNDERLLDYKMADLVKIK